MVSREVKREKAKARWDARPAGPNKGLGNAGNPFRLAAGKIKGALKAIRDSKHAPYAFLSLMTAAYIVVFTATTLDQYNMFWYGNFDLGIPDQGIWLLSRFKTPYLTTRGLNLFGDHISFIHVLVAPLYWVWDDVRALLILHTVFLGAGAVPVYLIARERFGSRWIPLAFSFSYLLYPAVHFSNLDQGYHYETFMVAFTLFGYWFLMRKKYWAYYLMFFLSLLCKEEIAFTYILFGIYIFFVFDKRVGAVTTVGSLVWLWLIMNVFFPHFNGEGAFYTGRTLGSFGETTSEKMQSLANPVFMFNKFATMRNYKYFMGIMFPVAFLVFHDLPSFAVSASFYLNLITDWPYAHDLQYHYVTPIIPFVYISVINAVAKSRRERMAVLGLLLLLISASLAGNELISPGDVKVSNWKNIQKVVGKMGAPNAENAAIARLLEKIPRDAKVSASYNLVSHLTHRERIYMFPNPFRVNLYGIDEKGVHPDKDVDFVVLDMRLVNNEDDSLRKVNESGRYQMVESYEYVNLYRNADYGAS